MSNKVQKKHVTSKASDRKNEFLKLISNSFSRKQRDLKNNENFQKELDKKSITQLSAMLTRANRKYDFMKIIAGFFSLGFFGIIISTCFNVFSKIGVSIYKNNYKYANNSLNMKFAYLTLGILGLILIVFIIVITVVIAKSLSKRKSEYDTIKRTLDLKQGKKAK